MIKRQLLLILGAAIVALVTACGGGGGGGTLPAAGGNPLGAPASPPTNAPNGGATAGPSVTMALTVTIPGKKSASRARGPQYIAPNSGSMTMTLLTVNGAAVSATAQGPFNLTPGPTNPNCVVATNTTCTFQISAPVGTDIFLANTYSTSNGTGQPLGSGSILLSVKQNTQNSANLSLTGPVASVQVVSATTALYNGNPVPNPQCSDCSIARGAGAQAQAVHKARIAALSQNKSALSTRKPAFAATPPPTTVATTSRIFVIALDAAGNQIINPTTFDIPITLTLSLNGTPAGDVTLAVAYAGLTGEPTTNATTSTDGGTVGVYAPSDVVTLAITGTSALGTTFAPTIVAAYTPQGGTPQASSPLAFSVVNPPPAAELGASATHVDPFTVGVAANVTDAFLNAGTLATSGQIEADGYLTYLTYNGTGPGSDPSWACTPYNEGSYYYVQCFSNAVVPPGGSLPIVFNVTPTGSNPAYNELDVYGGNAVNATNDVYVVDPITVNNTPTPALSMSFVAFNATFYATVQGAYTLGVTNSGSAATTGPLTLTDTLPNNFALSSYTGAGWNCVPALPTVTCTYAANLGSATSTPNLTLNVTPAQSTTDTNVIDSASISGGGANPFGPISTPSIYVSSPVFFDSAPGFSIGTQFGNAFAPGDGATLELGAPNTSPLDGSVSITTESAASTAYTIVSDTCGSVSDGTFEGRFPLGAGAVGTGETETFNIFAQMNPASCAITIQDAANNTATLNVYVDQTNITVEGHRRKSGSTR